MSSYSWPESGGSGGGVTSLNTLTGAVILSAGSNITLTPSGNTITIAATAANPFDQSLNTTDSPTFNALTLTTPLSIANGGTGQATAALAINALLPSQTGNNGKFLTTDGSVSSWASASGTVAIGAAVTGGTAGSTLFVDGSGDLAQDNANYFWDGTNHRLGIGNAVPLSLLSLGKAPSANIYPSLSASADPLLISNEAGPTRIRIGSAGSDISGASCRIRLIRALGTLASPTSVSSSSAIGSLNFQGYDGTTVVDGAVISSAVAGSVSSGVVPADLIFSNNNAGVLAENFRIKSTGVLNVKGFNAAGTVINDASGNLSTTTFTISSAIVSTGAGLLTASATTAAEIGFVSGVTSAIQTQLNAKQATGNYITALTGDGTASGPGSAALTLATVNSNVGSFGSSTSIPSITVNAKGLITAASGNAVIAPAGTLTGTLATSAFPALTGDITTSAGALATTAAATQANITSLSNSAGVAVHGTNTNNSASAGFVGEYIESVVGTTSIAFGNGTFGDVTSISLTAGDWDVTGTIEYTLNTAASWTASQIGISTTTGNSTTGLVSGSNRFYTAPPTGTYNISSYVPAYRLSLSTTTTVYLKSVSAYASGTPQASGARLSARRMR